jgi:hypothetical protein
MNIEFNGKIWFWHGPAPWYFVTFPAKQSRDLKAISGFVTYGWGVIPHAADEWDSARFSSIFNALAGFRFRALTTSRPFAANASRYFFNNLKRMLQFSYLQSPPGLVLVSSPRLFQKMDNIFFTHP